jgi:hypothetical protein
MLTALPCLSAFARQTNQAPVVSNVHATLNSQARIVTVTYDLSDAEQDTMRVFFRASNDSGKTFLVPVDSLHGDVGYPVRSGVQKQIRWYYPANLAGPALPNAAWQIRIIADDLRPIDIKQLVDQVDSVRLRRDVAFIQGIRHRTAGLAHLEAVKDSIEKRFLGSKLRTWRQPFVCDNYQAANIVGRQSGFTDECTTYIIDGHFDSVEGSPGADDNASGVAGLLESVRILSRYHFKNTIKFISFDLEETVNGTGLNGSKQHVASCIPSSEKIAGVINYEMIGYCTNDTGSQIIPYGFSMLFPAAVESVRAQNARGNFVGCNANVASGPLRDAFATSSRLYVPELRVITLTVPGNGQIAPDLRRSDHAPFWDAGYQALMLADGANLRNLNWHKISDTLETLNFTFMANVVKAAIATVATLAGLQHSGFAVSESFSIPVVSAMTVQSELPEKFALERNYPNPFNPSTTISYQLSAVSLVTLKVFDLHGREVAILVNETLPAGRYKLTWDASNMPSGVYFCRLKAGSFSATEKLILVK